MKNSEARKSFAQGMGEFIDARLDVVMKRLSEDPDYVKLQEERQRLLREYINSRLTFKEYCEYEDVDNSLEGMLLDETYIQGLKDGFMLAELLHTNHTLHQMGWIDYEKIFKEKAKEIARG